MFSKDDLEEASEDDIIAEILDPDADIIDLVWTEFVPLGINLIVNDKSGRVKVNDRFTQTILIALIDRQG